MINFDGRKAEQNFYNKSSGKRIYCWKRGKDNYAIGINGTNHSARNLNKYDAIEYIQQLISVKIKTY